MIIPKKQYTNVQSKETDNVGYTKHRTKTNKNTTLRKETKNKVNKTRALLQTIRGKDNRTYLSCGDQWERLSLSRMNILVHLTTNCNRLGLAYLATMQIIMHYIRMRQISIINVNESVYTIKDYTRIHSPSMWYINKIHTHFVYILIYWSYKHYVL